MFYGFVGLLEDVVKVSEIQSFILCQIKKGKGFAWSVEPGAWSLEPNSPMNKPDVTVETPSLDQIQNAREELKDKVRETPVWQFSTDKVQRLTGEETEIHLKLEFWQHGGSFKVRGALMNMAKMDEEAVKRGVTAVSAGNHAIAVAYAAKEMNTTAKVVMPNTANQVRIDRCREFGAEVVLVDDVHEAFDKVRDIEEEEGRTFVHPFDGEGVALGTGCVGLELMEQVEDLDAVIVPIGGGGLCAGIATAVKHIDSDCQVFGVEPEGADSMRRSFEAGHPEKIDEVQTIADSLGAPYAEHYSYTLCRRHVDGLCTVSDQELCDTMRLLFDDMKIAVEPAGAAACAALLGPLQEELDGKKVGIIVCGTNIDIESFSNYVSRGRQN